MIILNVNQAVHQVSKNLRRVKNFWICVNQLVNQQKKAPTD